MPFWKEVRKVGVQIEKATVRSSAPIPQLLHRTEKHVLRPVVHTIVGKRVRVEKTWAEVSSDVIVITSTDSGYTVQESPDMDAQCKSGGHDWQPFTEDVTIETSDNIVAAAANFCTRCGAFQFRQI
jgi:hypothetical protein